MTSLVLLNSIGATTEMWSHCLPSLREQFDVVAIDTRGHGGAPASKPGPPTTIADLAKDVLDKLDELQLDRVDLAGLSLGGMVGMWLATHHPTRINRLALLCTSANLPPARGWLERGATVRAQGMDVIADAAVGRWITPGLATADPTLVAELRDMLVGVDAESYAQCCEAIATFDLRGELGRIVAPTLVIAGAEDPATPPAHAQTIVERIATARLEILSPAAHLATVEQPQRIASLLLEHFAGEAPAHPYS